MSAYEVLVSCQSVGAAVSILVNNKFAKFQASAVKNVEIGENLGLQIDKLNGDCRWQLSEYCRVPNRKLWQPLYVSACTGIAGE
jgi:hypothetical protein